MANFCSKCGKKLDCLKIWAIMKIDAKRNTGYGTIHLALPMTLLSKGHT